MAYKKSTILVVKDHRDHLDLMSALLRKGGYEVLTAVDARKGFEAAQQHAPDLIISDVMMPESSGIELCRWLRAQPNHQTRPIMLASAVRVDSESAVEGLEAGADDYLEIPFDPALLIAKVARLLERSLTEEESARLAAIVDSSDDAIIGKTLSGIITSWNAGAEKTYGYAAEEVIGQLINILIPRDRAFELTDILDRLSRGDRVEHLETLRRKKDGLLINVSLTVSPIKNRMGKTICASSIARDTTERKRAEAELRSSEMQLRAHFDQALDAILITDDQGRCLDANPAACVLLGATRDEIKGRRTADFNQPGSEDVLQQQWQDFLSAGRQKSEFQLSRPDGTLIEVDYAAQAHFLPGLTYPSCEMLPRETIEVAAGDLCGGCRL